MPNAGVLVPARLRGRWQRIIESSETGLDRHLGDERVDVYLHDSLPDAEPQRRELTWAFAHGCRLAVSLHA